MLLPTAATARKIRLLLFGIPGAVVYTSCMPGHVSREFVFYGSYEPVGRSCSLVFLVCGERVDETDRTFDLHVDIASRTVGLFRATRLNPITQRACSDVQSLELLL